MPKFHTRLSIIEKKKITFIFILNFFCKIFEINMQIILCNIKKKHSSFSHRIIIYLKVKMSCDIDTVMNHKI